MPLIYVEHYTRAAVQDDRNVLWMFGDNLAQRGKGRGAGQAEACRDEPNAIGIPTKRAPSMREDAFLTDADLNRVKAVAIPRFQRAAAHLNAGGTVVLPSGGIGTGRAQLSRRAPAVAAWLESCWAELKREPGA